MGRPAKPTKLKLLAGNSGGRKLNMNEAQPKSAAVRPGWLHDEAAQEWDRLAGELESIGLLKGVDTTALAAYCTAFQRWRRAEEKLRQHGYILIAQKSKYAIASPYIAIANSASDQMRKYLIEFGMTPASRSKVVADRKPATDNKWAKFAADYGVEAI